MFVVPCVILKARVDVAFWEQVDAKFSELLMWGCWIFGVCFIYLLLTLSGIYSWSVQAW